MEKCVFCMCMLNLCHEEENKLNVIGYECVFIEMRGCYQHSKGACVCEPAPASKDHQWVASTIVPLGLCRRVHLFFLKVLPLEVDPLLSRGLLCCTARCSNNKLCDRERLLAF